MSKSVLFVCTGNTCRSPMAQVCANELFSRRGLDMTAISRGLATGLCDPISEGASEMLKWRYKKDISHTARQIDEEAVAKSDIIVGISRRHTEAVKQLFPHLLKGKIVISMPRDIPDPYGGDLDIYRQCLLDIEDGIEQLFCPFDSVRYEGFEIVGYENRHAAAVYEIEKASFSTPWSEKEFEGLKINPNARAFTAVSDGKVCGFAVIYTAGGEAELMDIAVHPNFRRMGIGEALMDTATSVCEAEGIERLMLEVRKSNTSAINLYVKKGFEKVGERKNYYSNPTENAELYDEWYNSKNK